VFGDNSPEKEKRIRGRSRYCLRFCQVSDALADISDQIAGYPVRPEPDLLRHRSDMCKNFWTVPDFVGTFLAVHISTGKILGFPTFEPDFLHFSTFDRKFFLVFQISSRKKFPKSQIAGVSFRVALRREFELVS